MKEKIIQKGVDVNNDDESQKDYEFPEDYEISKFLKAMNNTSEDSLGEIQELEKINNDLSTINNNYNSIYDRLNIINQTIISKLEELKKGKTSEEDLRQLHYIINTVNSLRRKISEKVGKLKDNGEDHKKIIESLDNIEKTLDINKQSQNGGYVGSGNKKQSKLKNKKTRKYKKTKGKTKGKIKNKTKGKKSKLKGKIKIKQKVKSKIKGKQK